MPLRGAAAPRPRPGHEISETSSALRLRLFVSEISWPARRRPKAGGAGRAATQPFSAFSASLCFLRVRSSSPRIDDQRQLSRDCVDMRRHTYHQVRERLRATVGCLALAASFCGGCGGGGGSSTSPSPTPPSGVSACNVIGGTTGLTAILNGTSCSPTNSSVVLVNLRDSSGPTGACSGTVIAPRAVLTAAHCLVGDTTAVRIFVGTGNEVPAESFRAHPLYREGDSSSLNDVGVVITGQDLPRTPIRLLVSRDARIGEQAVVAGWGKDENGNGTILRAGTTTVTSISGTGLQTQANSTNSGVCSGDSGGPLLLSEGGVWAIAGVTSATTTGGSCFANTNFFANLRNPDIRSFVLGAVPNAIQQ
jgi:hypothetical protein